MRGSAIGQDVRYNFSKDTDFSKFKTYKWVAIKDAQKVDDITDKQIKDAVDSVLATKGLEKTDSDERRSLIGYQAAIGRRSSTLPSTAVGVTVRDGAAVGTVVAA